MPENTPNAFDLDKDAFEKERDKLLSVHAPAEGESTPPEPATQDRIATILATTDDDNETEKPGDQPDVKPLEPKSEDDIKPFELAKPSEGPNHDDKSVEDFEEHELVYNGEKIVKRLNKEGLKAELQKAHKFDEKMAQITPYINLTNAILKNPPLANIVREYLTTGKVSVPQEIAQPQPNQAPAGFKFKSLDEYEGENAADKWFNDNISALRESIKAEIAPRPVAVNQPDQLFEKCVMAMQTRDPDNFSNVIPIVSKIIPTLRQDQAQQIEAEVRQGNITNVLRLYDHAKSIYLKQTGAAIPTPQQSVTPATAGSRSFRIKSSGPSPAKPGTEKPLDPWALSPKEFNKVVTGIKGY